MGDEQDPDVPPLLLAAIATMLGGLCLVRLDNGTRLQVLLLAYLLIGTGIGFANAPITNTASAACPSRGGVAGGLTSTACQFGAALGIAAAGGIVADTASPGIAHATRPGWLLVASCGVLLLLITYASPQHTR